MTTMPQLVFLATDVALYGLVAAIAFYVWHALRTPTLRQTWRSVLRDPVAMSAAVVLLVFLMLAALDSVHFRPLLPPASGAAADAPSAYSTRTLSVLDQLLADPLHAGEHRHHGRSTPSPAGKQGRYANPTHRHRRHAHRRPLASVRTLRAA